jgi:hypothetical protein
MGTNELLIFGVLIVAYLLFNYFMEQVAKRAREGRERAAQQQEAAPSAMEDEPAEYLWGRKPEAESPAVSTDIEPRPRVEAIATPAPAPRVTAPHALFRSTADLRHAIIVMTVLGPCRALQPYGRDSDK